VNATTPADTVIYVVGDIHGRHDLLAQLTQQIAGDASARRALHRQIVYLGDYVSRGLSSRRVVELLLSSAPAGFSQIHLKGNHEDSLLRYLDGDFDAGRFWFDNDGLDTLAHYGVSIPDVRARDHASMSLLRQRFADALPTTHREFFRSLRSAYRSGDYYFVHAGIRPGIALERQNAADCMWMREPFLTSDAEHGAVVVHGHSISEQAQVRHNRIGIDTGAYRTGVLTCVALEGRSRSLLQT